MSATPEPRRERNNAQLGGRLLGAGAVLAAIGIVLVLALEGLGDGIGAAVIALGSVPAMAGLALVAMAIVNRRARKDRPYG
jgi:hypothetical protein